MARKFLAALILARVNVGADDAFGGNATNAKLAPEVRNFKMAKNMLTHALTGLTGSKDPEKVARGLIRNYGCYCYPRGSKIATSKFNYHGPALDPLDNLCRQVFFRSKCFEIDAREGLYSRNQNDDSTEPCRIDRSFPWYVDADNQLQCGDQDRLSISWKRPCKMNNCAIELDFALKVAELYADPDFERNMDFKNMDDDTYQATCQVEEHVPEIEHEVKCCGSPVQTYERGSELQSFDYDRRIYNSLIRDCCDDGTVALRGACP